MALVNKVPDTINICHNKRPPMILIFYHRRPLYCLIYRDFFTGEGADIFLDYLSDQSKSMSVLYRTQIS